MNKKSLRPVGVRLSPRSRNLFETPTIETAGQYKRLIETTKSNPPYHLQPLLQQLDGLQKQLNKPMGALRILDHGCGGGNTITYLAALGYDSVFGVDVGGPMLEVDRALRMLTESSSSRVQIYDGSNLPFSDGSFDFVFSQQVIEHVEGGKIEAYVQEEARVLSNGGRAYHQIPHRWTPWESHTKTWCIHYLPRAVRHRLYGMLGIDADYIELMLHLRSPLFFKRLFGKYFSSVKHETLRRLLLQPEAAYYDGNIRLRNLVSKVACLPLVGAVLAYLVMSDLVARK